MDSLLCGESARETEQFAVTAATGALGPVLVKLAELLGAEYKLQEETRRDISSIKSLLETIDHDLLGKLWGRQDLDLVCKEWMIEARELSYDMEDGINHFTLGLERHGDGGFIQRETTGNPFRDFMESVKGVAERFPEIKAAGEDIICNSTTKLPTDPRALFLHKDASELVGMEERKDELIELLKEHEMVCIVGIAGTGKTTLADLVHGTIGSEFECQAFVSVHPTPNMMEILGTILSQVTNGSTPAAGSGIQPAEEQTIINDISTFLSDKRYLVIIDDIWHQEEWEIIRKALPKSNQIYRIIMTTRNKTIAQKCQTEQGGHVYKHSFSWEEAHSFSREEARRLSNMRLNKYVEGDTLEANLEELSIEIVRTTYGMPLAIICLWTAWAESHMQGHYVEWDAWLSHVLDRLLSIPSLKPLVQSLSLDFDDLPIHLKTCLLYCSMPFSSGSRDLLVRQWIAEGFVSQEEVAEAYFDSLVSRNLLLLEEMFDIYMLHPIMRVFLGCKAKEDNFFACGGQYNGPGSSSHAKKIRRLSLDEDGHPDEDVSHTRSLVVFIQDTQLDGVPFKMFINLRVLHCESAPLENSNLLDICGLIWLRYLCLCECDKITELPRDIGKLQHLETLDASYTKITGLPTEIGELQNLKTLILIATWVKELPKEMENLQYLKNLDVSRTEITVLPLDIMKLGSLESLDVSNTRLTELPKEIGNLQHLRTLDIRMTKIRELPWKVPISLLSVVVRYGDDWVSEFVNLSQGVFMSSADEEFLPSSGAKCREDLSMHVIFNHSSEVCEVLPVPLLRVAGRHLNVPQWVKQDLCNVSSLDIRLCQLGQDDLEFLKYRMPNLQALKLRLEVLPREPIAITSGGFLKLETFYLDCRLPRVTFQPGAMPKLKHLEFKFYTGSVSQVCSPMGITHLPELKKVIFRCSDYYTTDSPGISNTIEVVSKEAKEHHNKINIFVDDDDFDCWTSPAERAIIEKRNQLFIEMNEKRKQLYKAANKRKEANK